MSNPQENAPVAAPDNEEMAEAPETPAVDNPPSSEEAAEATAATEETESSSPSQEPAETPTPEAPEAPEATTEETAAPTDDSGETPSDTDEAAKPRYQEREALVAPDLSDLPDDIGDDFEKAIAATVLEFREGDIVEGTIVSVDSEGALVDIGYKSEGFIPTRELSIRNNIDPESTVAVGDRVESVVLD